MAKITRLVDDIDGSEIDEEAGGGSKTEAMIADKCDSYLTTWKTSHAESFPHVLWVPIFPQEALIIERAMAKLSVRDRELFKMAEPGEIVRKVLS
jgi:hypothetical protein